mgnify:CR=1 FL=1
MFSGDPRELRPNEISAYSAQHSTIPDNYDASYDARNSIDRDFSTSAYQKRSADNSYWLQVNLGGHYCIEKVEWFNYDGEIMRTYTCIDSECSCEDTSGYCHHYEMTISRTDTLPDPAPNDCRYGNSVRIQRVVGQGTSFHVYELAIIMKEQGKTRCLYVRYAVVSITFTMNSSK